jgi:hypothetical protein
VLGAGCGNGAEHATGNIAGGSAHGGGGSTRCSRSRATCRTINAASRATRCRR